MAAMFVWGWTLFAALGGFMFGYDIGAMSGVQHMAGFRDSLGIPIDNGTTCEESAEASAIIGFIVSAFSLGCIIGAPLGGVLAEAIGRKPAIFVGGMLYATGGGIQAGAPLVWVLILGRVVAGIGKGIVYLVVPIYIAEISPKQRRGVLVSVNFLAMPVGFLAGVGVSAVFKDVTGGWRLALGLMLLYGLILAGGMLCLPETPRWLVKKHKIEKATKVLTRVHPGEDVEKEVKEIQVAVEQRQKRVFWDVLKAFFTWTVIERVLIGVTLQLFGRLTGITVVGYYLVTILCEIGLDGYIGSVVIAIINVVICFIVTPTLANLAGRKTMLLLGTSVMVLTMVASGTLTLEFRLEERKQLVAAYSVAVLICIFYASFVSALQPAIGVVDSEMHPLKVRGISVSFTSTSSWVGNLIGTQIAPILFTSRLQLFGTFYLLAGINLLAFLFILLTLPETKGHQLERIGELFQRPWLERTDLLFYLRCGCPWRKSVPAAEDQLEMEQVEEPKDSGSREKSPLLPTEPSSELEKSM